MSSSSTLINEKLLQNKQPSVKLLTFNTWGLKYVSKYRRERLKAIADLLAHPRDPDEDYDIVALQEIWCKEDWDYFNNVCRTRYPYRRVFKSGIVSGPGLAILSKIPITETFLYRFPINGRPSAFFRGDWFVGKSIAVTLFQPHHPNALPIAILNSHMHAPYSQIGDASYSTHRACQAWDFAKLVKMLKRGGYAVIQVGDLNSKPNSLPYKLFTIEGGLSDSWHVLHGGHHDIDIAGLSPEDQVLLAGATCNSSLNTWRQNSKPWEACRLDYALIDANNIAPLNALVKFTGRLPSPYNCSYSDHFGYSAELLINSRDQFVAPDQSAVIDNFDEKEMLYRELLAEINEYQTHTIPFQSMWRKAHFIVSLFLIVLFHVFIVFVLAWGIPWATVLFLFSSIAVAVSGCINGLIWFCGVRSELRALSEVLMEVEDAYTFLKRQ